VAGGGLVVGRRWASRGKVVTGRRASEGGLATARQWIGGTQVAAGRLL